MSPDKIRWHKLSEEKPNRADLYLVYDPSTPHGSCFRIDDWICQIGIQIGEEDEPFFWDDEAGTVTHWAELTAPDIDEEVPCIEI